MNERMTVSLPVELAAEARRAVETGAAASVSSYIADAISAKAERQHALAELERVLGGPPPTEELVAARRGVGEQPNATPGVIGGRVLDTSALEHFATGRSAYARALVWAAVEQSNVLVVPTTALTTAWSRIPAEAHPVLEVLLSLPNTVVEILDPPTAHEVGLLLAAAGSRGDLAVDLSRDLRRRSAIARR